MARYSKLVLTALVLISAMFCAGCGGDYVKDTQVYTVAAGETLWEIANRYYDRDEKAACFDEFRCRIRKDNEKLCAAGRILQPGDRVVINLYYKEARK